MKFFVVVINLHPVIKFLATCFTMKLEPINTLLLVECEIVWTACSIPTVHILQCPFLVHKCMFVKVVFLSEHLATCAAFVSVDLPFLSFAGWLFLH